MNRLRAGFMLVMVLLSTRAAAGAGQLPVSTLDSVQALPWARGVPLKDQEAARALLLEGNARLRESEFKEAFEQYRKALERWDHPAIHYNLVLTMALLGLDQPTEMHRHLGEALRHGPAPLGQPKFEFASDYKRRLEQQLVRVKITCDEPGASVMMDGQPLFISPASYEGLVRPGNHNIIATKEGYFPTNVNNTLKAGDQVHVKLTLFTEAGLTEYRSRWPTWQPWALMGTGLALAAGGGFLHLRTREEFDAFDADVVACGSCRMDARFEGRLSRGHFQQRLAVGAYAVGGATLLTGAVLLYLNRPLPHRINPSEKGVRVEPLLGGGTGGAQVTFQF